MHVTYTDSPIDEATELAFHKISNQLTSGKRVLWLLSGGSSEMIAVQVLEKLRSHDVSQLFITMSDERFVDFESEDENWQQLIDLGALFDLLPDANIYRPLAHPTPNSSREEKSQAMNDWIYDQLDKSDYTLALFGIGSDGHTLGLKPGCSALDSKMLVDNYDGDDFERITMTPAALLRADEGILQVSDESKRRALNQFLDSDSDFHDQPAQLLKTVQTLSVFTSLNQEKFI